MDPLQSICTLLPAEWGQALWKYPQAEELRLRRGQRPSLLQGGTEIPFTAEPVEEAQLQRILVKASGGSLHAVQDELQNAYLSYRGLRIGICGEAILSEGRCKGFRRLYSLALRIPHVGLKPDTTLIEEIYRSGCWSSLILSPPGGGKTSFLRAMIRVFSEKGVRIGVIDERYELAAEQADESSAALGPCSDVLSGLPKQAAAPMLLKAMNPQVIAMDEITTADDVALIRDLSGCGVAIFATAHGKSREDMLRRPVYRRLLGSACFENCVRIELREGKRFYTLERTKT